MGWGYLKWYGVVSTHAVKGEGGKNSRYYLMIPDQSQPVSQPVSQIDIDRQWVSSFSECFREILLGSFFSFFSSSSF